VVLISANPIYDPDGAIRGAIVLVHYITNHLEVEKQVRKAATQLEVQHRLIDQREQERLQIARDLHDGPVQGLSAAVQMLKMVRMDASESAFAPQLLEIQTLLQQQADDLRTFTGELRPPALSNFGLATAIRNHVSSLQEKYPDIEIQYEEHQVGLVLDLDKRVALYRIFQESLTNVLKHARATRVRIRLQKSPDQIALEIQDNGVGFEIPRDWLEMARAGHLGLVGMRERAEAIGGSFSIQSGLKSGTTIQVVLPIRQQDAGDR
jgi:signal transduction histidine kinase